MKQPGLLALAALLCAASPARADFLESTGTGLAIALPVLAGGVAVYKDDWVGVGQLGLTGAATMGTSYGLKQFVREKRPDGSDFKSFPSNTTALAATGSSFLWARYGWEYGLPAFAASAFVGYTRVESDRHHWHDALASQVIAISYAAIFTSRLRRYNVYSELSPAPGGGYLRMTYNF